MVKFTIYLKKIKYSRSNSKSPSLALVKEKTKQKCRNNSVLVSEVDLGSSHQAVSMAGLNLFNPKTEANHTQPLRQMC